MSSDLFDVQIKTVGLDLFYGDNQVLKNITFDIGRKKVTAFHRSLRLRKEQLPQMPEQDE
jgi:phosphate ABC transporter ATP-binding protein, PhoT family (TC 3.A.1.7.1)